MKNITLAIEEELLKQARALAGRRHTSLNAIVRSLLSEEVERDRRVARAKEGLKRLMDESTADMGDYRWSRADIYAERENRIVSRLQHPDLRGDGEKK